MVVADQLQDEKTRARGFSAMKTKIKRHLPQKKAKGRAEKSTELGERGWEREVSPGEPA